MEMVKVMVVILWSSLVLKLCNQSYSIFILSSTANMREDLHYHEIINSVILPYTTFSLHILVLPVRGSWHAVQQIPPISKPFPTHLLEAQIA